VKQQAILSRMVARSQAIEAPPGQYPDSVRASMQEPGLRVAGAIEALHNRPDETTRSELSRCCLDYGATAIADARALFDTGELVAQVHPTEERLGQLIAEEGTSSDWARGERPTASWRDLFWENQREILDGAGPPAGLFDRLIVAVGLAADLQAWLDDPDAATERTGGQDRRARSESSAGQ
jgi:hypothetical protein